MAVYETIRHGTPDFPLEVHETQVPIGFHLYPHLHAEFEFLVMARGSGILCVDGVSHRLAQGDGAFVNAQSIHLGIPDGTEPVSFYAIVFSPRIFGSLHNDAVTEKYVEPVIRRTLRLPSVCAGRDGWQGEALRTAGELYDLRGKSGECAELEMKSRLFHLWAILCGHGERVHDEGGKLDELRGVMELIDREYASHLTLADLAAAAHMSESHFCRSFSAVTHMTPFSYLQQVRIQKSCQYLKNSDLPVSRIALSCGFNDLSYYARRFRERIGCTPSEYRRGAAQEGSYSRSGETPSRG